MTRPPPRKEPSLAPLIDVVFLLLTFFILAGQIQHSTAVRVQLPFSISEAMPNEGRIELLVDFDGTLYLEGKRIKEETLQPLLQRTWGAQIPAFLVKADASLPVWTLQSVLKNLNRAGVSRAALATHLRSGAEK